ncbi:transporter [Altererythrobacter xixiisoli]|uniref:Transporter n=2 Tax=Croceibacterium xixiisoli TaxID=1476466 RepID=A0A6I4U205_9SPHN|nr:transporter [Croceibacterium xixiisoli]
MLVPFGVLLSAPAWASVPPVLTMQDAVTAALAWHPSIDEAVQRINAQGEEIDVARAGYRPRVSGGISTGYQNNTANGWRPRANVTASQMLFDFGKVMNTVRFAEAGARVSRARLLLAVDSLIRDTSFSVIEIQRAEALLAVANDQLTELRAIEQLVRLRFERGAATRSDALQAQARVTGAEATIQQIEAEQDRWQSNLAYLLGENEIGDVVPETPEWLEASCGQLEPDWTDVPAIIEAFATRDQAMAEFERAKADRMPTISLEAGGSTEIQDPVSNRADYSFGIRVTSPLYNGGAVTARARGAGFALRAADAAEARVRNDISRLLAEAQQQVFGLQDVLKTLAQREADMRETGRLYRLQYLEMGTRTLVDLLNSQQELNQVRFDAVNTTHDLRRLRIDCTFYSGSARRSFRLKGQRVQGEIL